TPVPRVEVLRLVDDYVIKQAVREVDAHDFGSQRGDHRERIAPHPGALPDEVLEDFPHGPTLLAGQGRAPPPARDTFVLGLLIDAVAQNNGLELVAQELRGTLLRAEVVTGGPAHG